MGKALSGELSYTQTGIVTYEIGQLSQNQHHSASDHKLLILEAPKI